MHLHLDTTTTLSSISQSRTIISSHFKEAARLLPTMDVASRTLTVANAGPDLTALAKNNFNLQVAKSVAKGDKRALTEIQLPNVH
jgi:hypothetical protein